jgi:hypothetical protein
MSDSAPASCWGALEYLQFMMSGGILGPGVLVDTGDMRESMGLVGELAYATSSCIIAVVSWNIR